MKLETTDTQHNDLWYAVNNARETTDTLKVPKAALRALLVDHGALIGRLGKIVPVETSP